MDAVAPASASDARVAAVDDAEADRDGLDRSLVTWAAIVAGVARQRDAVAARRWVAEQHERRTIRGDLSTLSVRSQIEGVWFERDASGCVELRVLSDSRGSLTVLRQGTLDGAPARVTYGLWFSIGQPTVTFTFGDAGTVELSPDYRDLRGTELPGETRVRVSVSRSMTLAGPRFERVAPPPQDGGRYTSSRHVRASTTLEVVSFDGREIHFLRAPERVISFRGPVTNKWFRSRDACATEPAPLPERGSDGG